MRRAALVVAGSLAACSYEPPLEELLDAGYRALRRGELERARASVEQGSERTLAGGEPGWRRRFQVLRSQVLVEEQRLDEALAFLDAQPPGAGAADLEDARILLTRGLARCLSGGGAEAFRRAEADLHAAARTVAALDAPELASDLERNRGICALLNGDYERAQAHFREALATARRLGLPLLEVRAAGNLGWLNLWTRRYDDAAVWLERALDHASALGADLLVAKTLTNLGWCYYTLGDYERALSFLSRADSLAEARALPGERLFALQNLGNARYRLGDLARADAHYRQALSISRELGDQKRTAELLSNLGTVALEQSRYDDAEVWVREALHIKTAMGDLAARQYSLQVQGRIAAGRGEHARAETLYHQVLESRHSMPELLWETRGALADLRIATGRPQEAEGEFRAALAIMESSREELSAAEHRISFFSSLDRFYDGYVDFLIENGRHREALATADGSRARLLREQLAMEGIGPSPDVGRFQEAARAARAAILFYWTAPARSFLWLVTSLGVQLHTLPGEAELRERVEDHQRLVLRSRDPSAEGAPESEWLYRTLVGPVADSIPRGSRVFVLADGPLHWMNFETLVVPGPERRYWIEDVALTLTPSLTLLTRTERSPVPASERDILIFGDATPASEEFPALAYAGREIERIAAQFGSSRRAVYAGARAEPSAYTAAAPGRFSFIHFAAHASANSEIPLDSAVILSPRNDAYKLYAREIVGVPLRAELVSLSACRSAGSRTFAGEGLVGLAWAFLSAGAHNVIAGLWNVEDASTAQAMESLYQGVARGLAPGDALREAKLRLLRSDTAYRKPFYWAPFQVYAR